MNQLGQRRSLGSPVPAVRQCVRVSWLIGQDNGDFNSRPRKGGRQVIMYCDSQLLDLVKENKRYRKLGFDDGASDDQLST